MRRIAASLLAAALACPTAAFSQPTMTPEQEAAEGIRQVEQGDFETAVITLDSAVKRLDGQPGRQALVQNALLQLGVALVALEQRDAAKARFRRALELDPKLRLRADSFSPKVIGVFEQARLEVAAAAPPKSGGGGVSKPLILVGLGAAAAGVVLAAGGSDDGAPSSGATAFNARFTQPSVQCPNDSVEAQLPFIVIFDVRAGERPVNVGSIVLEMEVMASPDIPAEIGFKSTRPTDVNPRRVDALTTATLRADSHLLCTNGFGGPERYNDWRARIVVTDTTGEVLTVTTSDLFRVVLP
ncbi:MAG: tetratricopeptide repeat protein [Vicinamibacteria bacterium]